MSLVIANGDMRLRDLNHSASLTPERMTIAELVAQHPRLHPPVVEGLFRQGETVNLVSSSKIGKSWLAYDLALSIAVGQPWLDRYSTTAGKTLIIDNELHPSTPADRVPKVAKAMNLAGNRWKNGIEVWPLRGRLRSLPELSSEISAIPSGEFAAIILDAKYRMLAAGASENDNAAEAAFYNLVDQIAANTRSAIVLVHHATKGGQSDKRVTDVGAGAGAQSRS